MFDSGLGGVSVLRQMRYLMPAEQFLYYGDCANAPYGTRTVEEVRDLTIKHVSRLLDQGCKAIVVACNTATSCAIKELREMYSDIPIVGCDQAGSNRTPGRQYTCDGNTDDVEAAKIQ